jgi:predicted transposase YdaD
MNLSPVYEQWRRATLHEGEVIGEQRGWQTGQASLVLRLLVRRIGELTDPLQESVQALSLPVLEELAEASADFKSVEDLRIWLEARRSV